MSNPRPPLQSTPSKNKSAALSQAGNTNRTVPALTAAVAEDMKRAVPRNFDCLVKYFLSLSLEPHLKTTLDILQHDIESLQQHDDNEHAAQLQSKLDQRSTLLDGLYQQCLKAVTQIANDGSIRSLLADFYNTLRREEPYRYPPFVRLCNKSLEHLSKLKTLPLRPSSSLKIRFHVSHPKVIPSKFDIDSIFRKPDVICISHHASNSLNSIHPTLPLANDVSIQWPHVLAAVEFKRLGRVISAGAKSVVEPGFQFTMLEPAPSLSEPLSLLLPLPEPPPSVSTGSRGNKRGWADAHNTSNQKRKKSSNQTEQISQSTPPICAESKSKEAIDGRTQMAMYAMEMMSSSSGVHHVITILFEDEYMLVWYCDRQGVIRSHSISVIAHFHHVLVLLLAFTRFELEDWGIIPVLNPEALHYHRGHPMTTTVGLNLSNDDHISNVYSAVNNITINTTSYLSNEPHCIASRATAVFEGSASMGGNQVKLACKISNPEVQRPHEGETLRVVRAIADAKDKAMIKHLPNLLFHCDIRGTGTLRIRSILGFEPNDLRGNRVLRITGFNILNKFTTLKGAKFVKAWFEVVMCHAFLWKYGVEHGDPSLYNIMYDDSAKCGVLTDYDLTIFQFQPRTIGTDRTGTIPFMSLDLLNKHYWNGARIRYYHHEMEAFIWIVPFVFLMYMNQKRQKNTIVDSWITSDYTACREKKLDFCDGNNLEEHLQRVTEDFSEFSSFPFILCNFLRIARFLRSLRGERRHAQIQPQPQPQPAVLTPSSHSSFTGVNTDLLDSQDMWEGMIRELGHWLDKLSSKYDFAACIENLKARKPGFRRMEDPEEVAHLADIQKIYETVLKLTP